jgi:hypothetical protein
MMRPFSMENGRLRCQKPTSIDCERAIGVLKQWRSNRWTHRKGSLIPLAHPVMSLFRDLERFRAKWTPVRVKKTRQNKNLELRF